MFERLIVLRMAEEGLDEREAVMAVIRDNLFGLEIDPRCTQIAAFNLALAAWRRIGYCVLPPINLACSGLSPNTSKEEWLLLAGDNEKLQSGMERLYELFEQAPLLGSLIDPRAGGGDLLVASFHELQPLLEKALAQEVKDDTSNELSVTARGLAKAAEILSSQFTLVATNVPYLGRGEQCEFLQIWSAKNSSNGKGDIATTFLERFLRFSSKFTTTMSVVSPHEWWFLRSWFDFRRQMLMESTWRFGATLGEEAWESFGIRGPKTTLLIYDIGVPSSDNRFGIVDALPLPTIDAKNLFAIAGGFAGLRLDIRTHAGNSSTSVATTDRPFKEDGTASLVVEDDSLVDHQAMIVVIDAVGQLVAQQETIIGKE